MYFECCRRIGIFLNSENIYFVIKKIILLIYIISKKKKEYDLKKIEIFANLPSSNGIKDIQKILRHMDWYCDLIESYSIHASLLINLLKKTTKIE